MTSIYVFFISMCQSCLYSYFPWNAGGLLLQTSHPLYGCRAFCLYFELEYVVRSVVVVLQPRLSSTIELSYDVIIKCAWFRVDGRWRLIVQRQHVGAQQTHRWNDVDSTLIQRLAVGLTLFRRMCLLGMICLYLHIFPCIAELFKEETLADSVCEYCSCLNFTTEVARIPSSWWFC